jgi:hypothetical protein
VLQRGVASARKAVCCAEGARFEAVLPEPSKAKPTYGVEVTFLLRENLIEHFVDARERCAHAHAAPVVFQNCRVSRENSHAGTDCSLRKIHGRDGTLLKITESLRQLLLERGDKATTVDQRRISRARP